MLSIMFCRNKNSLNYVIRLLTLYDITYVIRVQVVGTIGIFIMQKKLLLNLDNLLVAWKGRFRIPGRSKLEVCVSIINSGKAEMKKCGRC